MAGSVGHEMKAAAARGVVGAMAMTGMRRITMGLGLLEQPPPDAIAGEHLTPLLDRLGVEHEVGAELLHWTIGGAGGAFFGLLPAVVRRRAWAGPAYGWGIWLVFETVLGPALGVSHVRQRHVAGRVSIAADHFLYGVVLGSHASWPPPPEHSA
jgi:hypothetical protein